MKALIRKTLSRPNISMLLFVLPALILVTVFVIWNSGAGFYYALTSWDGLSQDKPFIGLKNFVDAFDNSQFITSLFFTLKYTVLNVLLTNIAGIILSFLLNNRIRFGGLFRTIYFIPNIIALIVTAFTWTFIFNTLFDWLYKNSGLQIFGYDWFGDPNLTFVMILYVGIWISGGYLMIIYLTGLKNINPSLVEAAKIDGASWLSVFFKIQFPLIMPSVVTCVFLMTVGSLKGFDFIFAFTGGGPFGKTQTITVNIYRDAFMGYQAGLAAAKSVILFVIIMIITFIEVFVLKKREVEM